MQILCASYGAEAKAVLDALFRVQAEEIRRIDTFGIQGIQPWVFFRERGDVAQILEETGWLQARFNSLL